MPFPLKVVGPGLIAGAALAFAGIALGPDQSPSADTTTTTVDETASTTPPWYRQHETLVGTSAILPDALTVEGGEAVLHYQVLTIAPRPTGIIVVDENGNGPGAGVGPESWVIETTDGEYPGESRNSDVHEARFEVDDRFDVNKVTGIRITRYRMRVPYGYDVELLPQTGAMVTLDDGYSMSIATLLPQSVSFIVHLDMEHPMDLFSTDPNPVRVNGAGPEWTTATPRLSGGVQLVREGPEVPDPLVLRISSAYWVTFDRTINVDIGGLNLG